jgi:predicted transcriptional regulator
MHVHAYYHAFMRTTVEINDELRAKLLSLAAKRKIKGFSPIVEEALEEYLTHDHAKEQCIEKALAAKGSLDDEDANALEAVVSDLRRKWR